VSSRNLAVHDIVLRTAVVYDWSQRAEPAVPLPTAVVGIAAPEPAALTEAS